MNRNVILAAIAFLAVCCGLAVAAAALYSPGVKSDPQTHCPLEGPPLGYVALVVDETDAWSEGQLAGLRSLIRKIASDLRTGEKFEVFELPATPPAFPKPKFTMCSPGKGSDAKPLTQGRKLVQRDFERTFMAPLDEYLQSLQTLHSAPTTPLLEVLSAISEQADFQAVSGRRVLYIASDMLQNYAGVSHYQEDIGSYADLAQTAHGQELIADFRGAEVRIAYLVNRRATAFQGKRHIDWYRDYVLASGGVVRAVEPL